jgi:RES domain-containing protein
VPPEFTLLKIEGPDGRVSVVKPKDLPEDWRARLEATRDFGTAWLRGKEGVLLQVPSAIVPETANFLFNPMHIDAAKFRIAQAFAYPFDARLKM